MMNEDFAQKVLINVDPRVQKFLDELVGFRLDSLYKVLESSRDNHTIAQTQGAIAELKIIQKLRKDAEAVKLKKG